MSFEKKEQAFERAMDEAKAASDAKRIYQEIWERFGVNRKRGKSFAYTNLLADYSKYGAVLVPTLMSTKEHMQIIAQIEENIKNEGGTNTQEDARELVSSWLRGERELTRIPFEKIQ
jgi:hypothetical protein